MSLLLVIICRTYFYDTYFTEPSFWPKISSWTWGCAPEAISLLSILNSQPLCEEVGWGLQLWLGTRSGGRATLQHTADALCGPNTTTPWRTTESSLSPDHHFPILEMKQNTCYERTRSQSPDPQASQGKASTLKLEPHKGGGRDTGVVRAKWIPHYNTSVLN